jgi:hypothetical protein
MPEELSRPQSGDIVIWDAEPESTTPIYWVRTHARGSHTHLFEGPDAWTRARSTAERLAGPEGIVWKRYKDGRVERLLRTSE